MAATEAVSRLQFRPHAAETLIDIRRTRLPSLRPEEDGYDPKDHRAPVHEIKLWMAYFNMLRTMCGAGMLAMPLVISQTGIVVGPVLTLFTGFLIIHTHCLLLNSLYEIARQLKIPYISYRYGFRLALLHGPPAFRGVAKRGPTIIAIFMIASQLGICTVFVIFTTDCLRDLMDWQSSKPALMCMLFPYLLLEFLMRDLSVISYVAMSGNFLNLVGILIVFEHIVNDAAGETMHATTDTPSVLYGFGILLFNLSAVGVVLSIDKSLVNTRVMFSRFGVLNVGIFSPTILSMLFGSLGYWAFGTMEENILRSLPFDEDSSMAAIGLYLIAVAFAFPLQCYPAIATIVEVIKYHDQLSAPSEETLRLVESIARPIFVLLSWVDHPYLIAVAFAFPLQCYPAIATIVEVIKYHDQLSAPAEETLRLVESIARPIFVLLSFLIGYFVHFQGPFVAFVGNLCTSMLALVFPALMDICLRYPYWYGTNNYHLFKDLGIVAIGLTSMVYGVYICGHLIHVRVLSIQSPNNYGFF